MLRFPIIAFLLCFLFGAYGVFCKEGNIDSPNATINTLQRFSIVTKSPYVSVNDGKRQNFRFLYNLRDKRIVAVMAFSRDNQKPIALNPRYKIVGSDFVYGPIPELDEFTTETADSLYGRSISSKENAPESKLNSYELYMPNVKGESHTCYLDMEFVGKKLRRYRFRTPDCSSEWFRVNKGGAP